jgi:hypothetical protein
MVDRRLPEHSGRLRGVGVELIALDDAHSVVFPAVAGFMGLVVVAMAIPLQYACLGARARRQRL